MGIGYIIVIVNCDAGPILATGVQSRRKVHLIEGFITMYNILKKAGINPILCHIDNEYRKELIIKIEGQGLKY